MQKLIFLTFTHLLILNSPVKLPLHKFANTCSCTITQHLQIYKKKKASNFWLHTCKCPATQSIT